MEGKKATNGRDPDRAWRQTRRKFLPGSKGHRRRPHLNKTPSLATEFATSKSCARSPAPRRAPPSCLPFASPSDRCSRNFCPARWRRKIQHSLPSTSVAAAFSTEGTRPFDSPSSCERKRIGRPATKTKACSMRWISGRRERTEHLRNGPMLAMRSGRTHHTPSEASTAMDALRRAEGKPLRAPDARTGAEGGMSGSRGSCSWAGFVLARPKPKPEGKPVGRSI